MSAFVPLEQTDVDRVRAYATVFQAKVQQQINNGGEFPAFAPIAYRTTVPQAKTGGISEEYYKVVVYVGEPDKYVMMTVAWDNDNLVPVLTNVEWWPLAEHQAKKNIFTVLKSL